MAPAVSNNKTILTSNLTQFNQRLTTKLLSHHQVIGARATRLRSYPRNSTSHLSPHTNLLHRPSHFRYAKRTCRESERVRTIKRRHQAAQPTSCRQLAPWQKSARTTNNRSKPSSGESCPQRSAPSDPTSTEMATTIAQQANRGPRAEKAMPCGPRSREKSRRRSQFLQHLREPSLLSGSLTTA